MLSVRVPVPVPVNCVEIVTAGFIAEKSKVPVKAPNVRLVIETDPVPLGHVEEREPQIVTVPPPELPSKTAMSTVFLGIPPVAAQEEAAPPDAAAQEATFVLSQFPVPPTQ